MRISERLTYLFIIAFILSTGIVWGATGFPGQITAVPVPIAEVGTNATTASDARTNLGLAIGTNVQAYDADLGVIAGLADPNADRILFWDDSAGAYTYLTVGSGLSVSGTDLTSTSASDGWYIYIDLFQAWKAKTGTWEAGIGPVNMGGTEGIGNAWWFNSTNAQNDSCDIDIYIPAGTWVVGGVSSKDTNRAIFSFQLDSTERWTYDIYNGSAVYNHIFETGTYAVPTSQKYNFKLKAANRNASATGWYLSLQKLYLRRTL